MHALRVAAFVSTLLVAASCRAQDASPWQGEWGLDDPSASRLTISACTGQSCTFHLSHGGCSTSSNFQLRLGSPTEASATLPGQDATHTCSLSLHRDSASSKPSIDVKQSGTGCSYYCISGATGFDTRVIQHSTTIYAGNHSDECMKNAGPARMATCLDASLAALEEQWNSLYDEFPLNPVPKDSSEYQQATQLDAEIVEKCNAAADPAQCLRARFTSDIALMTTKKANFISGYTDRGDPAEGGHIARSIAGHYRHTFDNGDVQGHTYRSTDTLTLTPVGKASLRFDVDLNFYNGHSCSLSGGALYRKDGSFVYDDDPANTTPPNPVCHLAIVPSAKGIDFKDLTGGCKMVACGARGSWNGEGFRFSDRVPAKSATKVPAN